MDRDTIAMVLREIDQLIGEMRFSGVGKATPEATLVELKLRIETREIDALNKMAKDMEADRRRMNCTITLSKLMRE